MSGTRVRPADVSRFTNGDCLAFARQLHLYTGWTLGAYDRNGPDAHAFCWHPSGDVVDIKGRRSVREMRAEWSAVFPILKHRRLARFAWSDFNEWDTPDPYSRRRARLLAPIVAREAGYAPKGTM